jgi:hypothetical protein
VVRGVWKLFSTTLGELSAEAYPLSSRRSHATTLLDLDVRGFQLGHVLLEAPHLLRSTGGESPNVESQSDVLLAFLIAERLWAS